MVCVSSADTIVCGPTVKSATTAHPQLSFLQQSHEGKCEFMIIPCPSCKERIRFNEQERHSERECPERTLNCKYCKEPFHFKNIKVRNNSSSGYQGVSWIKKDKKWRAYIQHDGKQVLLGRFKNKKDAIKARIAGQERYGYHKNHGRKS